MTPLEPRELPPSSSFSTPHVQAFHGARFFHQVLEQQTAEAWARTTDLGGTEEAMVQAFAPDALQRQALSEAVQVFAALAVEGAINLLGIIILGEEQFYRELGNMKQRDKLRTLLDLVGAAEVGHGLRVMASAKRLADARNRFVHPRPQEGAPHLGDIGRRSDLIGARAAMNDLKEFFAELQQCDHRYTVFFVLF